MSIESARAEEPTLTETRTLAVVRSCSAWLCACAYVCVCLSRSHTQHLVGHYSRSVVTDCDFDCDRTSFDSFIKYSRFDFSFRRRGRLLHRFTSHSVVVCVYLSHPLVFRLPASNGVNVNKPKRAANTKYNNIILCWLLIKMKNKVSFKIIYDICICFRFWLMFFGCRCCCVGRSRPLAAADAIYLSTVCGRTDKSNHQQQNAYIDLYIV